MSDLKDNKDAIYTIDNEGIGYALLDYTSGVTFENRTTARLWEEATIALCKLETHLSQWDIDEEYVRDRTGDLQRAAANLETLDAES